MSAQSDFLAYLWQLYCGCENEDEDDDEVRGWPAVEREIDLFIHHIDSEDIWTEELMGFRNDIAADLDTINLTELADFLRNVSSYIQSIKCVAPHIDNTTEKFLDAYIFTETSEEEEESDSQNSL